MARASVVAVRSRPAGQCVRPWANPSRLIPTERGSLSAVARQAGIPVAPLRTAIAPNQQVVARSLPGNRAARVPMPALPRKIAADLPVRKKARLAKRAAADLRATTHRRAIPAVVALVLAPDQNPPPGRLVPMGRPRRPGRHAAQPAPVSLGRRVQRRPVATIGSHGAPPRMNLTWEKWVADAGAKSVARLKCGFL